MKFLKSSIARVWLEKIIFFEFVVIPIDSRQLLTENFFVTGGTWRALSKSRFWSMGSKNATSTLVTITFGKKLITNYPLTLKRVEFLKFSFLYMKIIFLDFLIIVKNNYSDNIFFCQNFYFIYHFQQKLLYIYIYSRNQRVNQFSPLQSF